MVEKTKAESFMAVVLIVVDLGFPNGIKWDRMEVCGLTIVKC